jgi:hypothetical protein
MSAKRSDRRPNFQTAQTPDVVELYLGKQVYDPQSNSPELALNACGFWAIMFCMIALLGGRPESLPRDARWVKTSLIEFAGEYHRGGLTQATLRANIEKEYRPEQLIRLIDEDNSRKEIVSRFLMHFRVSANQVH